MGALIICSECCHLLSQDMSRHKKDYREEREERMSKIPGRTSRKRINDILRNVRSLDLEDLEEWEDELEFNENMPSLRL